MIKIITHTPFYVWVLFAYLVWVGWKARKTNLVSWRLLLIMPAVMFTWSFYAVLMNYELSAIPLWAISLSLGVWLGTLTVRRLPLRFDKQQSLIEIGGSWTPMILSLTIFCLRYFLGVNYGTESELVGTTALLSIENIATVVSGMFIGRLVGYWQRYKTSPHTQLIKQEIL